MLEATQVYYTIPWVIILLIQTVCTYLRTVYGTHKATHTNIDKALDSPPNRSFLQLA